MKFASLGSGSRGNALIVSSAESNILIDCGLSLKALTESLSRIGMELSDLHAVFITHEHSDHIKGLRSFAKRSTAPIFMTYGTAYAADWLAFENINLVSDQKNVKFGPFEVMPVVVPHDAREPCQYVVSVENHSNSLAPTKKQLGVLTDLGSSSPHVVDAYAQCDALVLECNHDVSMLENGPYPPSLKSRVLGDWGHLSNVQARNILAEVQSENLQWLVLAHISQQNNSENLAIEAVGEVFLKPERTVVANQEYGFDWLSIE